MLPALILSIAALAAGHPVQVSCDADTNRGTLVVPAGTIVYGWSFTPSNEIHLNSDVCAKLTLPPRREQPRYLGDVTWGVAFKVLLHEARHASGIRSEACANTFAVLASFDYLRVFYKVPFYSPLSVGIAEDMLQLVKLQSAAYQIGPSAC